MRQYRRPWSLLALLSKGTFILAAANPPLPYNPTRILVGPNSTQVYIFQSSGSDGRQGSLQVVDISKPFATASLDPTTVDSSLPFLSNDALVSYTPVVDTFGNITVLTGDCTAGASSTTLWRFSSADGSWKQYSTISPSSAPNGISFLGHAVPFSSNMGAAVSFYYFGGMCPYDNSTASTWQSAATYSNAMLSLSPEPGLTIYDAAAVSSRAPPVTEAGFSMTPLIATYSINATGEAQTTQQDFLLIGGHTPAAFLNTSQVAVYSLPQEAWSFVAVQQPTGGKTDLALRQMVTAIEPRSGHTAVLSEDGTRIYVLGGWVGDVNTPASPQFAVLNLGAEYGGDASLAWTWSVPSQTGFGLDDGGGVYGHGAVMLPGGVMMVTGGYQISATSSSRRAKRKQKRATGVGGQNVLLYNTTSSTWIDSYDLPTTFTPSLNPDEASSKGRLSKTSQQTGLGVGLGVGIIVLALLVAFYFWYMRRLRRIREQRARQLVMGASADSSYATLHSPDLSAGVDGRDGRSWAASGGEHGRPEMSHAGGSTGMFFNNTPRLGMGSVKKNMISRPYNYHHVNDPRGGNAAGIHPILERQDEDDTDSPRSPSVNPFTGAAPILRKPIRSGGDYSPVDSDPFADPSESPNPLGSHPPSSPPSPTPPALRIGSPTRRPLTAEADGSMNWTMIEGLELAPSSYSSSDPFSTGRNSPTRTDDRTSSTLSDQSHRSATSGTGTSFTRTLSTTAATLLSNALWGAARETPPAKSSAERPLTYAASSTSATHFPPPLNSRNTTYEPYRPSSGTKRPYFPAAEQNSTLLSHSSGAMRDDPYNRALAAVQNGKPNRPSSTSFVPVDSTARRAKPTFMGSLRRALTAISGEAGSRTFSFTAGGPEVLNDSDGGVDRIAAYHDNVRRSANSSPGKGYGGLSGAGSSSVAGPRRTVSDGPELAALKRKRGRKDWAETVGSGRAEDVFFDTGDWGHPTRSNTSSTTTSGASSNPSSGVGRRGTTIRKTGETKGKADWNVEDAAQMRDVQVLFTVPKTRLRVVNADVDERASLRSVSDGLVAEGRSTAV
ncbi:unnamed protein product [Zymoseptoria tritici ST99CH_1E4]|uniref:Galactose oxidase-like Early set domain-containing protein n=1 Tax=Zymoseptoria tritici ST99CH_1E4 TaxID=1276532 RepID=A0A2H1H4X7_ZYMTR|nr:unnamed protein product [Zymoseptoria tritici ST99CH_1E4]